MLEIKNCVVQKQKKGCGAACLATVLGTNYWSIAKFFRADLEDEGLTGQILMDFLSGMGFDLVAKSAIYYGNGYDKLSARILEPFADIHIVAGYQYIEDTKVVEGKSNGHWLILTKDGKLLCPSDGEETKAAWLVFDLSIGIFYPPNWAFPSQKGESNALDTSSDSVSSSTD